MFEIYTDGGCNPNPGPGAWSYIIKFKSKIFIDNNYEIGPTTNNRMEMVSIQNALLKFYSVMSQIKFTGKIQKNIIIYSDSKIIVSGTNQTGKMKANLDLWLKIWEIKAKLINLGYKINVQWVKGHAGNELNNLCDELCSQCISQKKKINC